ncbi:HlyD family type I secretion periplasmic adaptor subunit [Alphaproteobacteria bacterium KMM 3653]|uniref:Membrane fusion protein (MFP) family protein n=1 Tax=Harenicola maris TaxID=2841044 RepID=A0AAP2CRK5_9RHOB|nr:HlyD family type I secretion periplasmic adaptor subunit [Harenicola maris]
MSSTTFDSQMQDNLRGPSMLIWIVWATLMIFVIWAAFARVDQIVRSPGELISASRPQIISNLEGGILAELTVKEGAVVEQGEVLARLQSTQFQTSVDDLQDQITSLEIRRLRLEAEMAGQFDFAVPAALSQRSPGIVASERALLNARQTDYMGRTDGARAVMDQANKENQLMERMLERKIVALIEVTRTRKAYSDAKARYDEVVSKIELERAAEYSDTLKELTSLKQTLKYSSDQLNRTVLVSPMRGIVNNLNVTTIGGVVRPGEQILEIIPLDDELFVEARVQPKDIAGVRAGQKATVKLSAYDYTIFGSLQGVVHLVSADTFQDETQRDATPHYRVTLRVDTKNLTDRQANIEIRPGMLAEVELHTGAKTILQYLTKPLYKSREAFREP